METYQSLLNDELRSRRETNSSYSLRSFAKDLGMSASFLSDILNEKRKLSLAKAHSIVNQLKYDRESENYFCSLVACQNDINDEKVHDRIRAIQEGQESTHISIPQYVEINKWYFFAILSAMDLQHYDGSSFFLAKTLCMQEEVLLDALEKLKDLGLVYKNAEDHWLSTKVSLRTTEDIPNEIIQKSHHDVLEMASNILSKTEVLDRDYSSMTMAIDSKKIPEAKKKIKDFRRELMSFLEEGSADCIYRLNIQLHPLFNTYSPNEENHEH